MIRRTNFFIEITYEKSREDGRIKERINLRKASRLLICHECKTEIKKNEKYIRDKFWYLNFNYYAYTQVIKTAVNCICLKCWRGEIPIKVSTNFFKMKKNKDSV